MSSSTKEEFGLTFLLEKLNDAVLNITEMEKNDVVLGLFVYNFLFLFLSKTCV